jgi:hypothetical protein
MGLPVRWEKFDADTLEQLIAMEFRKLRLLQQISSCLRIDAHRQLSASLVLYGRSGSMDTRISTRSRSTFRDHETKDEGREGQRRT